MRVAVVQTNPLFGEISTNIKSALALMNEVTADLFVLPELFNTGYNFVNREELEQLAEKTSGQTFQGIAEFSRKRPCHVVYGFAEQADRVYNSSALVGPSGLVGVYRKVHLFFREKLFFAPGNVGFPVFTLPFGRIGMMVCFDWMFPESARSLALQGAQLIAHPSNLVMPHCPDAMITRCLENGVFAATANRVGAEGRGGTTFTYIGLSEIVSPRGEILTRLDGNKEGVGVAEIDLAVADKKKVNEYNHLLNDRREGQYAL